MLETVALCVVLFDFSGLWISYLPDTMKSEVEQEIGFDPWGTAISDGMKTTLGIAAEGDSMSAWKALHAAEKTYDQLTEQEIVTETLACANRYAFLTSKSD
ncbi:hypothetical protein SAMN06265173_13810 [Thalassovita litoralis]|uniref:Uncharacterized protein n=1 Tax=Thalassovita litoralis TaxID=1010611 RepID=A0A521FQD6_9RHOB|nr:hypothetical protein [Thalassovita litoralis]SMO97681.1 hypothetical protein SAMN06265173_13810 [Thalassovita litoralis]